MYPTAWPAVVRSARRARPRAGRAGPAPRHSRAARPGRRGLGSRRAPRSDRRWPSPRRGRDATTEPRRPGHRPRPASTLFAVVLIGGNAAGGPVAALTAVLAGPRAPFALGAVAALVAAATAAPARLPRRLTSSSRHLRKRAFPAGWRAGARREPGAGSSSYLTRAALTRAATMPSSAKTTRPVADSAAEPSRTLWPRMGGT
jgi:hypothetical protein